MGQRGSILTQILGFPGWRVVGIFFELPDGRRFTPVAGFATPAGTRLVLRVARRWKPKCGFCSGRGDVVHELLPPRRWRDQPWAGVAVDIEARLCRVKCRRCRGHRVEHAPWAEPYQRQTMRFQQHLALEAASMPVMHVAELNGLGWATVRRAEGAALARWNATRVPVPLRQLGVDEKYLGRRNKLEEKFVTVVSNLETGEPLWIGFGRGAATLSAFLATLTSAQKAELRLVAMDMHDPFLAAIRGDPDLAHVAVVHDPFHVVKRAGETVDELRREVFFRAGAQRRGVGRGSRWLFLRAWEKCTPEQREQLDFLLGYNRTLARAYQLKEELREVLRAPDRASMKLGIDRILRRTQSKRCKPLRRLHDSLRRHLEPILALGEHRPAVGRVEALNNNWETLVRRARGYRDLAYLLLKLRFMVANPIRFADGVRRFLALGLPAPRPLAKPA